MSYLLLLRHAKSDWGDPGLTDHDRPLAPRGERAADRMRAHLLANDLQPDLVLCSSSRRTRETLDRLAPAFAGAEILIEDELYGAGRDELIERLRAVPDEVGTVAVIGHNPGIQDLALDLAGTGDDLARIEEKYPAGALAVLELDRPWRDLASGRARLVAFVKPRELG